MKLIINIVNGAKKKKNHKWTKNKKKKMNHNRQREILKYDLIR